MKGAKVTGEVRWGILGAAHIASRQFLPGLREAGGGRAALVASRDYARADAFANLHGVERAAEGYDAVVDSPAIDAVYVALPNSHHSRWTQRALETGKAVLCEKPLCVGSAQTAAVLETAATTGALLWESFVFPFQHQHLRLLALVKSGAIGEVRELDSTFSYNLGRLEDIRLSEELGGGALADVGCYPIRLAQEVLSLAIPPRAMWLGSPPAMARSTRRPLRSSTTGVNGWCSAAASGARSTPSRGCSAPMGRST